MTKIVEKNAAELVIAGLFLLVFLSSCGTLKPMTVEEKQLEYKIDKLYLEYSYQRDRLIIEHSRN
tara:strand:+ start:356 stop:550 length:195 start_codon:yes stop_codon:yes gene_type:complete